MKLEQFEKLDIKQQDEIADKFKDLHDMFCYEDDGQLTKEFRTFVVEEV